MSAWVQRWPRVISAGIVVVPLWALAPMDSRATLYECQEESGGKIFTDSPAQLEDCKPLKSIGSASSGSTPSVRPSQPNVRRPQRPYPAQASPGSPRTPPRTAAQIRRQQQLRRQSPAPGPSRQSGPREKAAAQPRCTSAVNQLNPLLAAPCPPATPRQ